MKSGFSTYLLIFFVSLAFTIGMNEYNLGLIRKANPSNDPYLNRSLVYNSTISNVDNYWYLNQMKNYLQGKGFTVDPSKYKYEVRRTPVYPLFYGLHYWLLGEKASFYYIRYTQSVLLALSVVALFIALYNFTGNKKVAWLGAILYGLNPVIASTAYCTITESLSIELVTFTLYILSLCKVIGKKWCWMLLGFFYALAILTRPSVIFCGWIIPCALILFHKEPIRELFVNTAIVGASMALLFAPWVIRNYIVTNGDIVILERYYGDPMDYGSPDLAARKWIACWTNPANFSSEAVSNEMMDILTRAENKDGNALIKKYINEMPDRAFIGNPRDTVSDALHALYSFYESKTTNQPAAEIQKRENRAVAAFDRMRNKFRLKSPLQYYIITPALIAKSVIWQSNSSLLAFLDGYENNAWKFIIKLYLLLLNMLSWGSLLVFPFWKKEYRHYYWLALLFIVPTIAMFAIYFRYCEARYYYPVWALLLGLSAINLCEWPKLIWNKIKS